MRIESRGFIPKQKALNFSWGMEKKPSVRDSVPPGWNLRKSGATDFNRWGFTLVEIVLAVVIAVIIFMPVSIFLVENIRAVFKAEDITSAVQLARLKSEQWANTPYLALMPLDTEIKEELFQGFNYDLVTIISSVYSDNIREIRIKVYPKGKSTDDNYLLAELITLRVGAVNQW